MLRAPRPVRPGPRGTQGTPSARPPGPKGVLRVLRPPARPGPALWHDWIRLRPCLAVPFRRQQWSHSCGSLCRRFSNLRSSTERIKPVSPEQAKLGPECLPRRSPPPAPAGVAARNHPPCATPGRVVHLFHNCVRCCIKLVMRTLLTFPLRLALPGCYDPKAAADLSSGLMVLPSHPIPQRNATQRNATQRNATRARRCVRRRRRR